MELVKQVAAVGVQHHGVGAGVDGETRGVAHALDEVVDVLDLERLGDEVREPEGAHRAGGVGRGEGVGELLASQTRRELHAHLGTIVVAPVDEHVEALDVVEVGKLGAGARLVLAGHDVGTGDDEAGTALGALLEVVDALVAVGTVRLAGGSHRGHEDAVLQLHGSDLGAIE